MFTVFPSYRRRRRRRRRTRNCCVQCFSFWKQPAGLNRAGIYFMGAEEIKYGSYVVFFVLFCFLSHICCLNCFVFTAMCKKFGFKKAESPCGSAVTRVVRHSFIATTSGTWLPGGRRADARNKNINKSDVFILS